MSDVRLCPSCGAQVSANERFCGNCGTRMDQPAAPTIPIGRQASEPTQIVPPSQAPSFGVPSTSTPSAPKRGIPIWAIILLSVLGLCAIGCVASIGIVTMLGQRVSNVFATIEVGLAETTRPTSQGGSGIVSFPTRTSDTSTEKPTDAIPAPTAVNIPTAEPSTSGGGIIDNTGGSAVEIGTAQAATTQALVATTEAEMASAEVYALIATGKEVFKDAFVDNRNAWFTGVFEEIETDVIEDGVFKVKWTAKGASYELYEVRGIANFVADVDCLIHQGGTDGSCGLVFDQDKDVGFYKFEVFDDYYRLSIIPNEGDPIALVEGDPAGIVKPGDVNNLRVFRRGDEIRIFLNGTLLNTLHDSTYQTGKIGVSTNSYSESDPVEIWFDNFTIWEIAGQ